jgi:hypothetical protein
MNLVDFTNQELIDYVYTEIAGKKVRENVKDFSDFPRWRQVVNELPEQAARVYRIGILNLQVMNGGFIQYFDNGYGIFAYETLNDLKALQAKDTHQLLKEAVEIINKDNRTGEAFVNLILHRTFDVNYNSICEQLDRLDNLYYGLEETEDMEELLGTYLRKHIGELKQHTP